MTLWFVFALMTAVAVFAVLWPLGRARGAARGGSDLVVYRDQLDEIERDRAAGTVAEADAEAARLEVSRRLLAAAEDAGAAEQATDAPSVAASTWRRRAVAVVALIGLPLGAGALYVALGSPELPAQPLAMRAAAPGGDPSIDNLVAQVEAHLEKNPEDGRGWEVLGPVYMRLGRFDDAVRARRNVLAFAGATPEREADLGEALTMAANGVVTADAKSAFDRSLGLDPKAVKARFFLGLAAEQDGRRDEAATLWRGLLAEAPANAPWAGFVRTALARVDPSAAAAMAPPSAPQASVPGPSSADVAAARDMAPAQQQAMIRGMVQRLADRLKQDGSDGEGWLRLVRAYMVLGEPEKARAAAADARRALEKDPGDLRRVDDLVKELGLEG